MGVHSTFRCKMHAFTNQKSEQNSIKINNFQSKSRDHGKSIKSTRAVHNIEQLKFLYPYCAFPLWYYEPQ